MTIPIFFSTPKPNNDDQEKFIAKIRDYLKSRGMDPLTLGVTDYDWKSPLSGIRRLMLMSNGVLVIGIKRYIIEKGEERRIDKNGKPESKDISGLSMTSPWCHIETAMAFQLGLPLLILIEKGVYQDGILEKGIVGNYLPEFDLNKSIEDYFKDKEFLDNIGSFEGEVRSTWNSRGFPSR
jgi:hypothetical protein